MKFIKTNEYFREMLIKNKKMLNKLKFNCLILKIRKNDFEIYERYLKLSNRKD